MNEDSLFAAAIAISDDRERIEFLEAECGSDSNLRKQVDELLRLHNRTSPIDHAPPYFQCEATEEPEQIVEEKPGTTIGRYKLLEKIGEGGFGLVFVAEQEEPVRRRVAIKVIKPGMDSRQVIGRFEAERQALAMMDHLNIAKVLDAGTTETGRPYFVMELVHGTPITRYCDENNLIPRQRLELFIPVCKAIQHAHQKGIIHRDIKPSNILVTMYDDLAVPKVIDFGISKALDQRLTDKSVYTQYGTMVGTLEYVSPEQAEMNAFGVDTRSDIYSLGALLYELLTGTPPFQRKELQSTAYVEMLRIIKEEEPALPSLRIKTSATLQKVAAARKTEPGRLSNEVQGELDWIVMRCLEKDRTRRYEGASALANDVQRYLSNEPVDACPPTLAYRFRKTLQKHRPLILTASLLAAILIVASVVSIASALRAQDAKQDAVAKHLEAEQNAKRAIANGELAEQRLAEVQAAKEQIARTEYATSMRLAQHELENFNVRSARQLLDRVDPGRRGWEWHFMNGATQRESLLLAGHRSNSFRSASFNAAGTRILTASRERHACLWDAESGKLLQLLCAPLGDVTSAEFDSTGTRILMAMADWPKKGRVQVLDPSTGREILSLKTDNPSWSARFNPAGTQIATTTGPHAQIWDASTGKLIRDLELPGEMRSKPKMLCFSSNGLLAVAGDQGGIHLWNTESWGYEKQLVGHSSTVEHIDFSPDASELVSVANDRENLILWNVASGEPIRRLEGHNGRVQTVKYSPNGKWIATGGADRVARVFNALSGELKKTIVGHEGGIEAIGFNPDGSSLVTTGGNDRTVRVWKLGLDQSLDNLHGPNRYVRKLSPCGRKALVFIAGGEATVVDLKSGRETLRFSLKEQGRRRRTEIRFTRGGDQLFVLTSNSPSRSRRKGGFTVIQRFNVETGRLLNEFTINDRQAFLASPSRNGNQIVSSTYEGKLCIWDTTTGKQIDEFKPPGNSSGNGMERWVHCVWSDDERFIAAAGFRSSGLVLWRTEDGKIQQTFEGLDISSIQSVAFNPEASKIYLGTRDRIKVLDIETGEHVQTLVGHGGIVSALQFSEDGERLLSYSLNEQTARLWDVDTGLEVLAIRLPRLVGPPKFEPGTQRIVYAPRGLPIQYADGQPLEENLQSEADPRKDWFERRYSDSQRQLWEACQKGDLAGVTSAIQQGANVEILNTLRNPQRALNYAAIHNHTEIIDVLLKAGASIDAVNLSGRTALHHAAEYNHPEAARSLLKAGADPSMQTTDGYTPLRIAEELESEAAAEILREATTDDDTEAPDGDGSATRE